MKAATRPQQGEFNIEEARAEAEAANERRRHDSMLEKEAMRSVLMSGNIATLKKVVNVPKEKARAEAQAAEERRRDESRLEKEAMRSVLMSRHNPEAFDSDKARAEAEAANERRRHNSMLEKEAMRSVLMSGNITTLKKVVNAIGSKNQPRRNR